MVNGELHDFKDIIASHVPQKQAKLPYGMRAQSDLGQYERQQVLSMRRSVS